MSAAKKQKNHNNEIGLSDLDSHSQSKNRTEDREDDREAKKRILRQGERGERIECIQNPSNPDALIASLKWMVQKGIKEDIGILLKARRNPQLSQEALQLIDFAVKKISDRDLQQQRKDLASRLDRMKTPLPDESDEIRDRRYQEILAYAIEVFESENNAQQWLASNRQELGGLTPNDILVTEEGCETVKSMLGRIDYGVYA